MSIGPFSDELVDCALNITQKKWRLPASLSLAMALQESDAFKAIPNTYCGGTMSGKVVGFTAAAALLASIQSPVLFLAELRQ